MTETEIEAMLAEAGLAQGSAPLNQQQRNDRVMAVMERHWPLPTREAKPAEFEQSRSGMEPARVAAVMATGVNMKLADGRAQQVIETPPGTETGAEPVPTPIVVPDVAERPA